MEVVNPELRAVSSRLSEGFTRSAARSQLVVDGRSSGPRAGAPVFVVAAPPPPRRPPPPPDGGRIRDAERAETVNQAGVDGEPLPVDDPSVGRDGRVLRYRFNQAVPHHDIGARKNGAADGDDAGIRDRHGGGNLGANCHDAGHTEDETANSLLHDGIVIIETPY